MKMDLISILAGVLRHVVLIMGGLFFLAPFIWALSMSIQPPEEMFKAELHFFPENWHFVENYSRALTEAPLLRFILNGVIVCAGIFFFQTLFALPCAYALAKLRFKLKNALFILVLVGLMIPHQVLAIPLYVMFYSVGILDTYAALIVPWTISVFGIFLMRQFFKTVPDDLIDAARLDGMGELSIVWRVMLPMAMPALVAFGIFSVVYHWNDLFWPLIVIESEQLAPPPLGILFFHDEEGVSDLGALMAATVIVTAPLIIAFLCAQRRFIEGITFTGRQEISNE